MAYRYGRCNPCETKPIFFIKLKYCLTHFPPSFFLYIEHVNVLCITAGRVTAKWQTVSSIENLGTYQTSDSTVFNNIPPPLCECVSIDGKASKIERIYDRNTTDGNVKNHTLTSIENIQYHISVYYYVSVKVRVPVGIIYRTHRLNLRFCRLPSVKVRILDFYRSILVFYLEYTRVYGKTENFFL